MYEAIQSELRPGDHTLEFGSGLSTFAFSRLDTVHTSVENDGRQYTLIQNCFNRPGFVYYRPMNEHTGWYYHFVPIAARVILVDGPFGGSRHAGLKDILACANDQTVLFVDDVHREDEMQLVQDIAAHLGREIYFQDRWAKI